MLSVASIKACMLTGRPGIQFWEKSWGTTMSEPAASGVKGANKRGVVIHGLHYLEILRCLEMLQQILALPAAFAVEDIYGQMLHIKADPVAEGKHHDDRHRDNNTDAPGVAHDLKHFFSGDGRQPVKSHCAFFSSLDSPRRLVSATKTSSRVGRIGSILETAIPRSER